MPTREGMMVEGEMLKRYTLRHGTFFGSYETAKEALAASATTTKSYGL